ncbi:MAG: NAD(+) synthase [Desulfovibrionaceae bacterium]|nr:NAD(+) synthase [Desulfovibrionaceae bacterium]
MRVVLLQHNPTPGDFMGNARRLADLARSAARPDHQGDRVLCLSSAYALAGVPWQGLTRVNGFYERCRSAASALAGMLAEGPDLLLSFTGAQAPLYALITRDGLKSVVCGQDAVLRLPGLSLYVPEYAAECILYAPAKERDSLKADAVLFMEARPFRPGDQALREKRFSALAEVLRMPVLSVNQCGATDGDIYAGQSCAFGPDGGLVARAPAFEEAALELDLPVRGHSLLPRASDISPNPGRYEAMFRAAVLGVRDYARKCGFRGAVLGLSGGMDSALVACIAAEALGPAQVLAVLMPSPWSSDHSLKDARQLAEHLEMRAVTAPIESMMKAYDGVLSPLFAGEPANPADLWAENIQPRIRGAVLMAFANRLGRLVLATGNKSELAVGYSTLYGDTAGAVAPIGDIYKTEVYELARWYNSMRGADIIPPRIFSKAPSAELKPNQTDQDSLPPYEVLDAILRQLLEGGANPETLNTPGASPAVVRDVLRRVANAEFKRHQCPPVFRLSSCALGAEWRMPASAKALAGF